MTNKSAPADPAARRDKLAGKTIAGRYVIERLIARGGMAAVYQAHQVQLNRKVAIKILRPPPDTDEGASFHERFRLEAETLAQLNHPNIVTVYDHGDFDDDQVFLAMEFVDGVRLTDLLREGPLPVERTLHLLLQVCEALRYAHRRGVVHRDLKPSNLLITRTDDGEELVKVVDFGLVKLTEVDVTITSAGLILGSPHCMAPEQVRGQDVDPRTDVYAMGVLLFRCLTGTYPFHGANSTATMIAHLNQPTPTFFSVAPDLEVPEGLENVARRCLAKNPGERFQSMEALQDALAFFLNVTPDQYRTVTRTHSTLERFHPELARQRRRPIGLFVAGGLGALLLLVGISVAGVWIGTQVYGRLDAAVPAPAPAPAPVAAPAPVEAPPAATAPDAPPEPDGSPEPEPEPAAVAPAPQPAPAPRPAVEPTPAPTDAGSSSDSTASSDAPTDPSEPADDGADKPKLGEGFMGDMDDW